MLYLFSRLVMVTIIRGNKNGFVRELTWLQQVSQKLLKISKICIDGREKTHQVNLWLELENGSGKLEDISRKATG